MYLKNKKKIYFLLNYFFFLFIKQNIQFIKNIYKLNKYFI